MNTRLYFVDSEFNLHDGGFVEIHNDSNEIWKGEIGIFNVDPSHMALFDAVSGKKQQIRLVQHKQFSPGRFRVYWKLEQPIYPGQTRYGVYWTSDESKLPKRSKDSAHQLVMSNCFGCEAVENFILVVPDKLNVCDSSIEHLLYENVEGCNIYVWQKRLPKQRLNNTVEVSLDYCIANYSPDYIERNKGKVLVEIPEVFELANIAIAISEEGLKNPYRVNKKGDYYKRVLEYFEPFKDHPLIKKPDLHYHYTYPFRDNSICYVFDGDRIVFGGLYSNIRSPDIFKVQLKLVEDFARISNFRKFYQDNLSYYQQQIQLYRDMVPVRKMWIWLEERFPARHDCYKVVFSPLLGGSHETCSFQSNGFSETIMFISGPGESKDTSNEIEKGCISRGIFTEIDHNYVNSVTSEYAGRVNEVFSNLDEWNRQESSSYPTAELTFNEYMTWAVFVLYVYDNYEKADYEVIVKKSAVDMMVYFRKFVRFKEFSDALLELYRNKAPDQCIPDLYPAILDWAQSN